MTIDAIDLEVVKASLSGIVQEMQNSLFRTGFSTIVRESQDASCALMNAKGEVVAQHVVLPLHIGAFPACTAAVIDRFRGDIADGDAFIINHPYHGGSPHAPDIAVITPVFIDGALFGFCGSIAHKSDIGGPVPGSCSGQAREIFNEGLHLPAVRYQRGYRENTDIARLIGANSRTPELVLGDIRGQLGADRLGEKRLAELVGKFGREKILAAFERLFELSESKVRAAVAEWEDGRFEAERFVDDDGIDLEQPVRIHVVVEKTGDRLHFDFSGSAGETKGPANIRPPLVQAACAYTLISLIDPNLYVSSGLARAFTMTAPEGSVLNPRFPAPVNTYNPTIHALVDAIFDAMSHVVPGKARADGSGSRSIILGGRNTYTGKGYVQYEIIAGGAGARAGKDGASGITVNQSNAKIAPIEIIESEFPTRVTRFELIVNSGGAGEYRGGLGIRREYLNLADARFSIRSMKHVIPPSGCAGGGSARPGAIWINPDTGEAKRLPTRYADYPLRAGDAFQLDTPGGGGYGDPLARDPEHVLADVREGAISPERAERDYGVVLTPSGRSWLLDHGATQARRAEMERSDKSDRPMPQQGIVEVHMADDAENAVKRAGVIGLGAMGVQMARHMVSKGFEVVGYDVDVDAMRRAGEHGVKTCLSAAQVGVHADVVVVMVATDAQVEEVIAQSRLLDHLGRGAVVCIASSSAPETCRRMEKIAAERGIGVLDCPVVLGQDAANNGTLTCYVGGEERWFTRARPALAAFSAKVLHLGPVGTGQIAKTINNMLLWACMAANFESLTLARGLGADVPRLIEALAEGSGANWSLSRWGRGTGKWAEKDMDVALDLAQHAKVPTPLAALVDQLMKQINQTKMQALLG